MQNDNLSADELTALVLETGKNGVQVMALLDKAHNDTYGSPEITKVNIGVGNRPGILISGHDLKDIEQLLEQSENSGVDIYTHSEMLPAHYYPKLKKNTVIFLETTAAPGGNKMRSLKASTVLFCSRPTASCLRANLPNMLNKVYTTGSSGFTWISTYRTRSNYRKKGL